MVVNDFPSSGQALEDQCEQAMRLLAIRHSELPCAGYYSGPSAEQIDIQLLKFKFSHFLAFRLIALAITRQSRLPSTGFRGAGKECQVGRAPVALHKAFQLAVVPGFDLSEQHMLD